MITAAPMLAQGLALSLARAQFGFTIAFHIMFPAFSIGLASFLAVLEAGWLISRRQVFLDAYKYWLKIFSVSFAMGVVSGLSDRRCDAGVDRHRLPLVAVSGFSIFSSLV